MITYHAESLEDLAKMFDDNAASEERSAARHTVAKHAAYRRACAGVWRTAAEILRTTKIAPKEPTP